MYKVILACLIMCLSVVSYSKDKESSKSNLDGLKIPINKVLDAVAKNTGKRFVVSLDVIPDLVVYHFEADKINYSDLLAILGANYLAAVDVNGVAKIVAARDARELAIRVVTDADKDVDDNEVVTKVISTGILKAGNVVAALRPLVPQYDHMTAYEQANELIVTSNYANIKRLEAVIKEMQTNYSRL